MGKSGQSIKGDVLFHYNENEFYLKLVPILAGDVNLIINTISNVFNIKNIHTLSLLLRNSAKDLHG